MDRSTKATLSTYNTWIQISRLQKIYHFQSLKLRLATNPLIEASKPPSGFPATLFGVFKSEELRMNLSGS